MAEFIRESVYNTEVYMPPTNAESPGRRLYLNENVYGPAPECLKPFLQGRDSSYLALYTTGGSNALATAIASHFEVDKECVFINQGSASVLQQIFIATVREHSCVCLPSLYWGYYRSLAELFGCEIEYYPVREQRRCYSVQLNDVLVLTQSAPQVLVLNSPHMPTGCATTRQDIGHIAAALPGGLIVVDEAYWGFGIADHEDLSTFLAAHPNVVLVRTFSKYFGLAGLRVGFGLAAPSTASQIAKLGPLFGLSRPVQDIAIAALEARQYYSRIADSVCEAREEFIRRVNTLGSMVAYASQSNFVLLDTGTFSPRALVQDLAKRGYLIRDCSGYGLHHHVRITVGTPEDMDAIAKFLEEAIKVREND